MIILFKYQDPHWTNIRRRLTSAFSSAKLKILQDFIRCKSKELVQRIETERKNRINLKVNEYDFLKVNED